MQAACTTQRLQQQRPFGARPQAAPRRAAVAAQAFAAGQRVRVSVPVTIYHSPKFKEGLNLEGLEGEVQANVMEYKGATLSANLPFKVALAAKDAEGKDIKIVAHLAEEELTAV